MSWLLCASAQAEAPGVLVLEGPWEIEIHSAGEGDRSSPSPRAPALVGLPSSWLELGGEPGDELILRMSLRWPPEALQPGEPLGLLLPPGGWGWVRVELDGEPIADLGRPTRLAGRALPVLVELDDRHALGRGPGELVVRCVRPTGMPRSWLAEHGPLGGPPSIGDRAVLLAMAERSRLAELAAGQNGTVLAVFLTALGLLHLHLFLRRRRSPEYLWFGLAAVDFALALLSKSWLGELGTSLLWGLRWRDAAAHGLIALMIQLLWTVLGRPISDSLRWYQGSHAVLAVLVMVSGERIFFWSSAPRWAWGCIGWVVMLVLLIWGGRRLGFEGRIFGLGAAVVVVSGIGEWFAKLLGWGEPFTVSGWAFLVFALTMAISLGGRFHRDSSELEVLHHQLERMVEDRSAELSAANEQLRSEIAERQLAEEAMRMLERAVEQSIDGILVTDLDGRVQFANQAWARMHGREPFDCLGHGLETFHTEHQMDEEIEPCLAEVRQEGAFAGEIFHRHKDGRDFPCWTTVTLLRDGGGKKIGFVFVGRDVSEQRAAELEQNRLELKVRQAKRLESLGNLAGGIAHDYNNLLTGVLGNATLLQRSLLEDSPIREKVRQIELAAERAVELTSQLLAYAGEDPLLVERWSPRQLLDQLEPGLRELVPVGVELAVEVDDDLPEVGLDPRQVGWALRNLVRNGVEAMAGQRGRLTIRAAIRQADRRLFAASYLDEGQSEGTYFELDVSDTGGGIDPEVRDRIFDPFFSTRASARGLGLATVLGVVRAHRGAVVVDSELGVGTSFCLLFPLATDTEPIRGERRYSLREDSGWRGSGKILVVDDESLMREVSASILEEQGFEVLTASEGHEAVAIFRREHAAIRLVLLDRTMPRMSGDQVLHEIRQIDPQAVVVMMSGFKRREALAGLEEDLLSGFIQKPFRPDELVGHLRQWLEGRGSTDGGAGDEA